ncbi:MAG: hypothetical protein KGR98_02010, partial [Verrucomicrobia bacterium]|nr:hypothetical protein [Verrucomicrobiota bacterium]
MEGIGSAEVGANVFTPMGVTNNTGWAYLPLYAMSFDTFPAWRSHFVDNPYFLGTPLPPTYTGRSPMELNGLTAVITNQIWLTNNPAFTNLDDSPELRRSPILDQFVNDMGRNPLALANYVINEIGLTDPMGDFEYSQYFNDSVCVGGVNRSALGTFLEGRGSPVEQCALLVYLLRAAGYPAAYVWPTNSNLKLMDTTLSRLWQINVHGVIWDSGVPVVTNSLITVNYPWVVANIGTNTVQIFPWLKNTEIVEGQNIYDYAPTNYPDAYSWVKAYAFADPSLMALGDPNDGIMPVWKKWLTDVINTNSLQSNLSLDDFGVRAFDRRNTYTSWSQLPVPDFLTNQSQAAVVQTLSDSSITYPFLTNMFDRIRIQVFNNNTNASNQIFDTGLWRACDLENRKLLLYTNTPSTASLWMDSYRPGITAVTNFQNFDSGTNALDIQIAQTSVPNTVSNFQVLITYERRDGTLAEPANWFPSAVFFSGPAGVLTCSRQDMTAIIPGVSRVTQPMLQVYADDYQRLEQEKAANTNFVPAVTDEAGDSAMILASSFFQKLWDDDQFNQHLQKVRAMTWFSDGTAALTPLSSGYMQVKLNMNWFATQVLGNGSLRQDSGDKGFNSLNNYLTMLQAEGSSAEHSVIASVWGDPNPVSSIRLLQLAAQRAVSNGFAPPLELNIDNYNALGSQSYAGYGGTLLENQIPGFWAQATSPFTSEWDSNLVRVLMTPGPVTNVTSSFKGMSALIFGQWQNGAVMTSDQITLNGGWSDEMAWIGAYDDYPSYDLAYTLDYSPSVGYSFIFNNLTTPQPQFDFSPYSALTMTSGGSGQTAQVAFTPQQITQASVIAAGLNLSSASPAAAIRAEKDTGWFGRAWAGIKQAGTLVAEPVQVVSGNLYADDVDMTLAGPMPLQLRRNYLSGDLADGPFGAGWKLSFTPWLVLTTNAANDQLIDAAEPDGSVLAYRYQSNSLWTVTAADNPDLVNFTASGIGGKANLFNNFIEQNPTNSAIYTLFGSDGSRRTYEVMTNFAITAGTNQMDRIRSYLTRWQDHAGNYYQFTYGTNPTNNDFGQLYRVQGANGASLTFKYDFYGRIIEAISDDDRIMRYQYDNYGDLVSATLPDDSQWQYGYDHYTFTTNGLTYTDSDHLLTSVTKPDGRQFVNAYDNLRRVVMQEATVGVNRELITNAWFYYTNDCTGLTNDYISGVTRMDDVFSNSYFYYYTSNLVTEIRQPLGRTNIQSWFDTSQSNQPGYYQRGLQFAVDVRGLTNAFLYDSNGNATNRIVYGDLTGSGIGGQSATNTCTYTTNNCLATATSPSGNEVTFRYGNASDPYQLTSLEFSSGGIGVSTNLWSYTNVTTTVDMGGWSETNSSFGLCNQEVLGDSATNQWLYNGRGFPVQLTRYAASAETPNDADPPVVEYFSFTPRGDLATATDADGRQADMTYDEMGRLQWRDVLDQNSNAISRENFYYNQNGQLEWYDGPRYNPDDYVYFSYDGAGRKVQEIRWRSRVNANATGIEPETGDNLYGTTFYTYDPFGNLTFVRDQRGAFTTNFWDALGRLSQRNFYDTNGATVLATEGFGYEAGGLIQYYTNALGGVAETLYNGRGQPRFRKNADNSTNAWTYYLDGRMDREIQGNGAYWETTYNDPARTVTRIFHSVSGAPLATNVMVFDSRANPVQWTDAGGNTFTRTFDGLDRVRRTAGPAIVTVLQTGMSPGGPYTYVTNVLEQAVTNFYDAANDAVTNVNEPGDRTVTTFDALGRATGVRTYAFNSVTPLRVTTVAYAPDNNSYTITRGTGANAISTTTYTDPEDRPLLSVAYPSPGTTDVVLRQYDSVGNLLSESQGSVIASSLAAWKTKSFTYDGLNRVTRMIDRDDALTTFSYDSAGDIQQRAMPGNLAWSATYNNAGQILTEKDSNGAQTARSMSYTYYPSGNPDAGLLDTLADGNGVTQTRTYDDWLRLTNVTTTGALPEQQMTRDWQFDARGFLTDMTQSFANPATGPSSEVKRSFDPYGQLSTEAVYLNGGQSAEADQSWDAAGRRTRLSFGFGDWQEGFQYQADDLMTSANGAAFGYADNGLLIGRTNAFRSYFVNQRDGEGRPLDATTTVSGITQLMESWSWLGDGSPAGYTAARGDFTDTRDYDYASLSRRLTGETFNVSATQSVTNIYTFDNGAT